MTIYLLKENHSILDNIAYNFKEVVSYTPIANKILFNPAAIDQRDDSTSMNLGKRVSHLAVGILLIIPIVNLIAMPILERISTYNTNNYFKELSEKYEEVAHLDSFGYDNFQLITNDDLDGHVEIRNKYIKKLVLGSGDIQVNPSIQNSKESFNGLNDEKFWDGDMTKFLLVSERVAIKVNDDYQRSPNPAQTKIIEACKYAGTIYGKTDSPSSPSLSSAHSEKLELLDPTFKEWITS